MGQGINEQFSDNPQFNIFGVVTGTVTIDQFPAMSAKIIRFKADPDNVGVFKLGSLPPNTVFFPMSAGDDTGWVASPSADGNVRGLTNFYHQNLSGSSDYLYFWIQR